MVVAVGRKFAVAEIVVQAAAVLGPVLVERGHGQQVGNVNLVDELVGLADEPRNQVEPLHVDGGNLVDVDGARNAADKVVRVRILAAEDGMDLDDFLLPLQRVEIVRHADQVHLGRQLVGRMAPVAVGEDAQTAGGKGLDLVLHFGEVGRRVLVPLRKRLRQLRGLLGIGLERVDDVHPVERVQVIKVDHVILHVLRGEHDVADELRRGRHRDAERILNRAARWPARAPWCTRRRRAR